MDASGFVFLDETGTATNMTRRYGRSLRGHRVIDATPHGHWLTTTFVAGLRQDGIIAPLVLDGAMTGEVFRAYVEQILRTSSRMISSALRPGASSSMLTSGLASFSPRRPTTALC